MIIMKDLLKNYAERYEELGKDYSILEISDTVKKLNELNDKEHRYNQVLSLLEECEMAEGHNKIVMWNKRINNELEMYNTLIAMGATGIPSPTDYVVKATRQE